MKIQTHTIIELNIDCCQVKLSVSDTFDQLNFNHLTYVKEPGRALLSNTA